VLLVVYDIFGVHNVLSFSFVVVVVVFLIEFLNSKKLRFGTTHVIQPKGEHLATIVWLHGLGDVGERYDVLISLSGIVRTD
jgi:hypothetical protein